MSFCLLESAKKTPVFYAAFLSSYAHTHTRTNCDHVTKIITMIQASECKRAG